MDRRRQNGFGVEFVVDQVIDLLDRMEVEVFFENTGHSDVTYGAVKCGQTDLMRVFEVCRAVLGQKQPLAADPALVREVIEVSVAVFALVLDVQALQV